MIHIRSLVQRMLYIAIAATLLLSVSLFALLNRAVAAAEIYERSLAISDSAPGAEVTHTYTFKMPKGTNYTIDAVTIEYCTTAFGYVGAGRCAGADEPIGFDSSAVTTMTVSSSGGDSDLFNRDGFAPNVGTNYLVLDSSTNGTSVVANDVVTITTTGGHFVNPSTPGTFYARIYLHSDQNNLNASIEVESTVTASVANQINLETRVEETLNFSVGTANDDDTGCAPLTTNNLLELGDPINHALSTTQTYDELSYFRIATNASNGAQVLYSGDTLNSITNAGDDIDPVNPKAASQTGTEQFGIVIDESEIDLTGAALVPAADYADGDTDQIHFDDGSVSAPVAVAASTGAIDCETAAVRYVANISNSTPAGIYTTTISYIAVPSY